MSGWNRFCVLFLIIVGTESAKYQIKVASLKKCNVSESKMDKSVNVDYNLGIHKVNRQTTLIQTNFTIGRKMGPMFVSFRNHEIKQNGAEDLALVLNKVSCKNPAAAQFVKIIRVKVDKDCYAYPGTYVINDINLDDISWIFTNSMIDPGRYSYDIEVLTDKGIAACFILVCDIVKRK